MPGRAQLFCGIASAVLLVAGSANAWADGPGLLSYLMLVTSCTAALALCLDLLADLVAGRA